MGSLDVPYIFSETGEAISERKPICREYSSRVGYRRGNAAVRILRLLSAIV